MAQLDPIKCQDYQGWYAKVDWQLSELVWAVLGLKQGSTSTQTVGACESGYFSNIDHVTADGFCKFFFSETQKRTGFRLEWNRGIKQLGYSSDGIYNLHEPKDVDIDDTEKNYSYRILPPKELFDYVLGGYGSGSIMRFYDFSIVLESDGSWLGSNGQAPILMLADQDDVDAYLAERNKEYQPQNTNWKNETVHGSWTDDLADGNCPACFTKTDRIGFYGKICEAEGVSFGSSYLYYTLETWAYDRDIIQKTCELEDKNPWKKQRTRARLTTYQPLIYNGSKPIDDVQWKWLKNRADNFGGSKQNYNWVDTVDEDSEQMLFIPDADGLPNQELGGKPISIDFYKCGCPPGFLECFDADGQSCCLDCCEDIALPVVNMFKNFL